jgi:hypothetical protein
MTYLLAISQGEMERKEQREHLKLQWLKISLMEDIKVHS